MVESERDFGTAGRGPFHGERSGRTCALPISPLQTPDNGPISVLEIWIAGSDGDSWWKVSGTSERRCGFNSTGSGVGGRVLFRSPRCRPLTMARYRFWRFG